MNLLKGVTSEPASLQCPMVAMAALGNALHSRDHGTHAHSLRVVCYAVRLGRLFGLSQDELTILERGVFLHDVGKIHVPDAILNKPGPLTESEWKIMRRHPSTGYAMLSAFPSLREAARIVLAHHERYDGSGYPRRLKGEEIPFGARIFSVVDALDALTSADRPYRRPSSFMEASGYIRASAGTHFDPAVVDAFLAVPSTEWQELQASVNLSVPPLV